MALHTQVSLHKENHRATVTFRTESALNVASIEFLKELEQAVDQLAPDTSVRFVEFRAEGKVFLAGANIKAMVGYDAQAARQMAELGHRVFNKIEALPQVTLAAVHGAAMGGGCELILACDFRFAVKTALIGQPEVLLGLIPGWGGTIRLPRLVPLGMARRMMFSGQSIKADQAHQIGLVDELVNSAEDLEPRIHAFFDNLAKAGPQAVATLKKALRTGEEISGFAECFTRDEARQGMTAFLEKKPPPWS